MGKDVSSNSARESYDDILVIPVSGGKFPIQLSILQELYRQINYVPNLTLASSGGNVSAYISLAADWDHNGLTRVGQMMHSDLFVSSWWPGDLSFLPSILIGFFMGSTYNSGKGVPTFFNSMFTKHTITRNEIWTGAVDKTEGKAQFFCNKACEKARIKPEYFNPSISNCLPLIYLDGNVKDIADASLASASIPLVIPEQIVKNRKYVDGGALFASPLTGMSEAIQDACHRYHITYVNIFDINANNSDIIDSTSMLAVGNVTFTDLVKSLIVQDRLVAIGMIRDPARSDDRNRKRYISGKILSETLVYLRHVIESSSYSLLELYPDSTLVGKELDPTNFSGKDVLDLMAKVKDHICYRLWYVPNNNSSNYDATDRSGIDSIS